MFPNFPMLCARPCLKPFVRVPESVPPLLPPFSVPGSLDLSLSYGDIEGGVTDQAGVVVREAREFRGREEKAREDVRVGRARVKGPT